MKRRFKRVDVFGARPFLGNPVAVILDGQEMGRDARLLVSVSEGGSRIDIGGRAITLIDGTMEA